ncbi:hypothetical protein CRUP_010090, partial [Coryphaenoides rupestris]
HPQLIPKQEEASLYCRNSGGAADLLLDCKPRPHHHRSCRLSMSSADSDAGVGGLEALQTKTPPRGFAASGGSSWVDSGWTRGSCPCCASGPVEPLVLVQLRAGIQQETKDWIITVVALAVKQGGQECVALSAHPGEEPSGDIIVISAPRCTLLRATEELGLCKAYHTGDMTAFSYHDRDNFPGSGQKLQQAGVVRGMFPLNHEDQLKALSDAWYSGNQLVQPLDMIHAYFGGTVAFYFSFLDFYTWSLLPPAVLGLLLTLFSGGVNKEALDSISGSTVAVSDEGNAADDDDSLTVSGHMIQAVFSMLWSTVVMEMWKRRSTTLAYRWGNSQLAARFAEPRPSYHGDLGVNPVT